MVRTVKREPVNTPGNGTKTRSNGAAAAAAAAGPSNSNNNNSSSVDEETIIGRRILRSHYLNFKNRISGNSVVSCFCSFICIARIQFFFFFVDFMCD